METALKKEGIKAVYNFPIRCKYGYIIDFAIPKKKIVIECDGERWHPLGNKHDKNRDNFLINKGWTILRFRGKEIEANINFCINKIKKTIEDRN